ncbi:hypothetical protein ENKNEFLB_04026 [Nocardioides aquaticus]|uniref:Uncharacterized protein n=1 Tax=Nocardioides aquaticus TaxID=160826 RepID=A0ABX8EM65_9ACTN|nr:hypothetical protein ENKNEFLB_04026 [Nocardioides aquaticus]
MPRFPAEDDLSAVELADPEDGDARDTPPAPGA